MSYYQIDEVAYKKKNDYEWNTFKIQTNNYSEGYTEVSMIRKIKIRLLV